MSGVDGYKPVEDDLEPIENLTPLVQSSNPDKAIWDRIPESNLLVSLRWLPFVTTGISVFGMYALKYLISPPSPRTLLRRRIALAVYCAHTSYSCYYALSFAKEASLRHNKAYHDDFGGLSPMWICTERLILYSGEVRKAIETINTNAAREDLESRRGQYDKFRELVPAESEF
ncbi:hypothetical protein K474DRAFT_1706006 [Panus rudis PR-1116 ss-1]|nr:hypothetical protein K474DRAFT_1706006 [Panus rudis PR-1116 ss-1]